MDPCESIKNNKSELQPFGKPSEYRYTNQTRESTDTQKGCVW
jgi:hypothetical protein